MQYRKNWVLVGLGFERCSAYWSLPENYHDQGREMMPVFVKALKRRQIELRFRQYSLFGCSANSHQPHRPWISRHDQITSQQRDPFYDRLSDKQTVKRILMDRRQTVDRHCMLACNRQFVVIVIDETAPKDSRVNLKIVPAQAAFDRNLPQARRAIDRLIPCIAWQRASRCR
jgi:hypothetical protein